MIFQHEWKQLLTNWNTVCKMVLDANKIYNGGKLEKIWIFYYLA